MNLRLLRVLFLMLIVVLPCSSVSQADDAKAVTLQIAEQKEAYELSVPVSQLIMTIPKGGLAQTKTAVGGSTASPRYFLFEDKAIHLIISGWFESDDGFKGIKAFWKNETNAWSRGGLPAPQDVSFEKIGNWDAIIYDISVPSGSNSHIRAHWVQAGTWIDIHISLTSERPSAGSRARLKTFLNSILVKEKK